MEKVIFNDQTKIPIKTWLSELDEKTMGQVMNLSNLPFAFHHIAILPDAHLGYGMPIGGVMATHDVIIPHAVGSDIGCGVLAARLPIKNIPLAQLRNIRELIEQKIPMGVGISHKTRQVMPSNVTTGIENNSGSIVYKEYDRAEQQMGTLGAGNHFIEFQKGSDGFIWIMIHSGSRGLGYKVADYYNKRAIEKNKEWFSGVDPKWELAFLPINSELGRMYYAEMLYCVEYAKQNRLAMYHAILESCKTIIPEWHGENIFPDRSYDVAHNYAALEHHFGKDVWVHRKGATRARQGEIGLIPGSPGTKSYVVRGRGNLDSFMSCSHGAGRKMSRNLAKKELNLETEMEKLDSQGILHGMRSEKVLDEAPGAYKDIQVVMANQSDLVNIEVELTPIMVIKGQESK